MSELVIGLDEEDVLVLRLLIRVRQARAVSLAGLRRGIGRDRDGRTAEEDGLGIELRWRRS